MKQLLLTVSVATSMMLQAQNASTLNQNLGQAPLIMTQDKGIKWTTGLSWEQIKQKAKATNKYIFIDAFATWCTPCKKMDKAVYPNDTVGNFYNDKFISVKVQMDKTKNDNEFVKSWYGDAEAIQKSYHVEAYPSFIFLSPEGSIVHMDKGYTDASDFVALAKTALTPGKVYNDPYTEYYALVQQYREGIKNYEKVPYMVKCAFKLKEVEFGTQLIKDHLNNYAKMLPKEKRYTKETIEMWRKLGLSTQTTIFRYFYEDGKLIDKVMGKKGYSEEKVDNVIRDQFINPFFKEQNKDSTVGGFGGMYISGGIYSKAVYQEADWKKLEDSLRANVNTYYTKKNLLWAKGEWYKRNRNYEKFYEFALEYDRKYLIEDGFYLYALNENAYGAFKACTSKKIINGYINLMASKIKTCKDPILIDTYASLLYKAERVDEAIIWEGKAVDMSISTNSNRAALHTQVLGQMKKGEHPPNWEGAPVVWGYE